MEAPPIEQKDGTDMPSSDALSMTRIPTHLKRKPFSEKAIQLIEMGGAEPY